MEALSSQSHRRSRRAAPIILVLVLLALPLLVYVGYAVYSGTGADVLAMAQNNPAALNDRLALASSVTGGRAGGIKNPSGSSRSLAALDTTPPVITFKRTPDQPNGAHDWYVTDVTLEWTVTDPESAIVSKVGCDPLKITKDQVATTYTCTATNSAGLKNQASTTIKRDASKPNPPSIVATKDDGTAYVSDTWTNRTVTVRFQQQGDNGPSGNVACTPSITISSDQNAPLTGNCTDDAGNISDNATPIIVKVDKTAPIAFPTTDGTIHDGWYAPPLDILWNWADNLRGSGIDTMRCTTKTPVTASLGEGTITLPAPGQVITCYDLAGNVATPAPYTVKMDRSAPYYYGVATATSNGAPYTAGSWTKYPVIISFPCTDAYSGPVNNPVVVTWSTEGANQDATAAAALCKDKVGWTAVAGATFRGVSIDMTPPNPPTVVVSPQPNQAGWNNAHQVTVSFVSAGDAGTAQSGVASCTAPVTLTAETAGTVVTGTCTDKAGNVSAPASKTIKIDWTPPLYGSLNTGLLAAASSGITATSNGKPYTAGTWTNASVEVSFQCSDALSGPVTNPVKKVVNEEGANLYATATAADCMDYADNQVGSSRTFGPIKIDWTKPVISGSRTPGPNVNGWNNTDVTVNFTCAEVGAVQSGIVSNNVAGRVVTTEGQNQSVTNTGACTDAAGNSADPVKVDGINIDKTNPNAPAVAVSPPPNIYGWNNTATTVTFGSKGDAGSVQSGVVWCEPAKTLNQETAGTQVSGTCKDAADNVSAPTAVIVKIDWTKPVITASPPPEDYLLGCQTQPTFSVSDNLSGADGAAIVQGPVLVVAADGSIWNRFTVTARDKAGNEITNQYDYLAYKLTDPFWLSPINPDGSSLFNLGNTIPVKFLLYDCSNQPVTNVNARLRAIYLGPGQQQGEVNTNTKTGGGDSGSQFRRTGEYYQYNWSTKGLWVGDYQISVMIGSAPIRSVRIGLR